MVSLVKGVMMFFVFKFNKIYILYKFLVIVMNFNLFFGCLELYKFVFVRYCV